MAISSKGVGTMNEEELRKIATGIIIWESPKVLHRRDAMDNIKANRMLDKLIPLISNWSGAKREPQEVIEDIKDQVEIIKDSIKILRKSLKVLNEFLKE